MKRRVVILVIACIALAGFRLSADESKRSFQIANKSSFEISEIAISPAGDEDWSDNFLGDDTLVKGDVAKLAFEEPDDEALYDLMIADDGGEPHFFKEIPLAKVVKVTVLTEDGNMTLRIEQGK